MNFIDGVWLGIKGLGVGALLGAYILGMAHLGSFISKTIIRKWQ